MIGITEGKSLIELQQEVFKIPTFEKYLYFSRKQTNGNNTVVTYICREPRGLKIPNDFLVDFQPEIDINTTVKVDIVTDDQNISDFKVNEVLSNYLKNKQLQIEVISVERFKQDQNIKEKEFKESRSIYADLPKEEIDKRIDQEIGRKRKYSSSVLPLHEQVKFLLKSVAGQEKKLLETEELDTDYTENAPKEWPKDADIPNELYSILGKEYPKNILIEGMNPEKLYNEEEIGIRIGYGRAWPIPSLIGNLVYFRNFGEIHDTIESYVQNITRLPFVISKGCGFGGVGVYRHLHTSAGLAIRKQKPNIVYLEIYGSLMAVNGYTFAQVQYEKYLLRKFYEEGKMFIPEGPLIIQIVQANLSNYSFPGIGIPYYE